MVKNKLFKILLWSIMWIVVFDLSINLLFPYPVDPGIKPNAFQEYFEYGRSIEGKMRGKVKAAKIVGNQNVRGGWLDTNRFKKIPIEGADTGKLITIYGMSHANCLAQAMIKSKKYRIRNITTGGAPLNWSFAAFQMDKNIVHSDIAILSVMTIGVADMATTSGMTAFFEHPYTYTFPRYQMEKSGLIAEMPPFTTNTGFVEYFSDKSKLQLYKQWLEKHDTYYSKTLFNEDILDFSVLMRALKRVYYTTFVNSKTQNVYSIKNGFKENCNEVITLKEIVHEFALMARKNNVLPFVYIVNNQGCRDDLYRLLRVQIEADSIPYLSTHIICPPSDPTVYGGDGHFTIKKDEELALAVFKIIEEKVH